MKKMKFSQLQIDEQNVCPGCYMLSSISYMYYRWLVFIQSIMCKYIKIKLQQTHILLHNDYYVNTWLYYFEWRYYGNGKSHRRSFRLYNPEEKRLNNHKLYLRPYNILKFTL